MLDRDMLARLNELPTNELLREVLDAERAARAASEAKELADRRVEAARASTLDRLNTSECRNRVVVFDDHAIFADGNRLEIRPLGTLPKRFPHYAS